MDTFYHNAVLKHYKITNVVHAYDCDTVFLDKILDYNEKVGLMIGIGYSGQSSDLYIMFLPECL